MDSQYKQRLSPSKAKQNNPNAFPHYHPKSELFYERHIPSHTPKQLKDSFDLLSSSPDKMSPNIDLGSRTTYNLILQNELLGTQYSESFQTSPSRALQSKGTPTQAPNKGSTTFDYKLAPSSSPTKLFNYSRKPQQPDDSMYSLSPMGLKSQAIMASPKKIPRKISKAPIKVLEAPSIQDDFYLNLVDWSSQNILAVGLHQSVYLWNASTSLVTKLCDLPNDSQIASVSWMGRGSHLAIGSTTGGITLWDIAQQKQVRSFSGHKLRVGTLAWSNSPRWMLSSGSRDRSIINHDVRCQERISTLANHKQEVCGLKWGYNPTSFLASGGNDNKLFVWDSRYFKSGILTEATQPIHQFTAHRAAVKAITWSPHQRGLLASGGGTADQCIRFWNTVSGQTLPHIDTGSQVCNLAWSKNVDELVSTHGYSQNQISVWHYPSMSEVASLTGHSMRVLYLAVSPDGQTVVTGAGDETLRFWNLFPEAPALPGSQQVTSLLQTLPEIR